MKRELTRLSAGLLVGMIAFLAASCGGSPPAQPSPEPAATATAAPGPTATPDFVQPSPTPAGPTEGDLVERGKLVFEQTAGGVGCAYCHGLDGRGNPAVGGVYILGASETQIRMALTAVDMMSFINLSDAEMAALVAYLQYLAEQP